VSSVQCVIQDSIQVGHDVYSVLECAHRIAVLFIIVWHLTLVVHITVPLQRILRGILCQRSKHWRCCRERELFVPLTGAANWPFRRQCFFVCTNLIPGAVAPKPLNMRGGSSAEGEQPAAAEDE